MIKETVFLSLAEFSTFDVHINVPKDSTDIEIYSAKCLSNTSESVNSSKQVLQDVKVDLKSSSPFVNHHSWQLLSPSEPEEEYPLLAFTAV